MRKREKERERERETHGGMQKPSADGGIVYTPEVRQQKHTNLYQ